MKCHTPGQGKFALWRLRADFANGHNFDNYKVPVSLIKIAFLKVRVYPVLPASCRELKPKRD